MTYTSMTSVYFHMTSTFMIHHCFSDMTSTLMTSVFFRHDIYVDDISVFHMTSRSMTSVYFT